MAFIRITGCEGLVYVPDEKGKAVKRYPCHDCYSCQGCGEDRCRLCRMSKKIEKNEVQPGQEE